MISVQGMIVPLKMAITVRYKDNRMKHIHAMLSTILAQWQPHEILVHVLFEGGIDAKSSHDLGKERPFACDAEHIVLYV